MPEFYFHIDQKITSWERMSYTIEADTYEEAETKMKEEFVMRNEGDAEGFDNVEHLTDSTVQMEVEDNNGASTRELFHKDKEEVLICNNATDSEYKPINDAYLEYAMHVMTLHQEPMTREEFNEKYHPIKID